MSTNKRKKINKKKVFLALAILIILIVGGFFIVKSLNKDNKKSSVAANGSEKKPEKKLQIVDVNSKSRSIAVMINNHHNAWPHAGLQDAYLVYEIMTEGGITRMMALYKDKDTAKIGSVRSSRHYFLDYALENDAIYAHFGWSPKAQSDIQTLNVANINGLYDGAFWRDTTLNKDYEHTAFTSIAKLKASAQKNGYRSETEKDLLLEYSIDELDIKDKENAVAANNVMINYSTYHNTSYVYDSVKKVYKRSMSGKTHADAITGEQYTAKNIIVAKIKNFSMDSYGRQDIKNIGTGDGYYITNGYAVPIKWEKSSRSGQTVYKYLDGKEIVVNDGNTYIQIQPIDKTLDLTI